MTEAAIKLQHPAPYTRAVVAEEVTGLSGAVPLASSYTMVEVVSPSSVLRDRSYKPELYALPLAVGPDTWITGTLDPAELVAL